MCPGCAPSCDDFRQLCQANPSATASDGTAVDLRPACTALAGWDLRADLTSHGTHLFREFVRAGGLRFADTFDPADPVHTPNQLATTDPAVLRALADAARRLTGIPLDAPLGQVQTEPRGTNRIPSGRQILTYSQSTDPTSRRYADQTRLYSREGWDGVKFTRAQLAADATVRTYVVERPG